MEWMSVLKEKRTALSRGLTHGDECLCVQCVSLIFLFLHMRKMEAGIFHKVNGSTLDHLFLGSLIHPQPAFF